MNSQLITYPSRVEKKTNHTVVVIDADVDQLADIGMFCSVSEKNYDVYIYSGDNHDLEWLCGVSTSADHILISEASTVAIHNVLEQSKFGKNQNIINPLGYFETFDKEN